MKSEKKVLAVIPARLASTRFPRKPMEKICGIPMIGHVYLRTKMSQAVTETVVATCDPEIVTYIESIGGKAILTSDKHERASDRCAEALLKLEAEKGIRFDLVAMIQGDEPLVFPEMVDQMVNAFDEDNSVQISNLMGKIANFTEASDSNGVKVVVDVKKNALYFSREPIPSKSKYKGEIGYLKQFGLITFTRASLLQFAELAPTTLEEIESVDMMRFLEHGVPVKMVLTEKPLCSVDTPSDLVKAESMMKKDSLFSTYS